MLAVGALVSPVLWCALVVAEAEPLKEAQTFTLQFQDIEVRRAIHTLGELAYKDVVVSDGVSGTVPEFGRNLAPGLGVDLAHPESCATTGRNVLTIAPVEQFEAVRKAEPQRQQELLQLQPLATELRRFATLVPMRWRAFC